MASRKSGKNIRSKKATPPRPTPHARTTATPRTSAVEAKPAPQGNGITRQAIAEAAYFLWQQRGGSEVVNWLEAEAMLKAQHAKA